MKIRRKSDYAACVVQAVAANGRKVFTTQSIANYISKTIIRAFSDGLGELVYLDRTGAYIWHCFDKMEVLKKMEIGLVVYDDFELED